MHTPETSKGNSHEFYAAQSLANVAVDSTGVPIRAGIITVCDVDLPFIIAEGELYVQATLPEFFDAVQAQMAEFFGSLEARVSEARRTALASADLFPTVHPARLAESDMVRNRGEQR